MKILAQIFKLVFLNNSTLIALHQNKYCMRDDKVSLDLGPFVKAVEYASNKKSILMGKREKKFFELAVKDVKESNKDILMVVSNSGVNHAPIEAALIAKKKNIKTIAITSCQYSRKAPLSKLKKRLYKIVDIYIDNKIPAK